MILNLPLELKRNVFTYLKHDELFNLSYTCKEMRYLVFNYLKCEYCNKVEIIALCFYMGCNRFFCEDCFSGHFYDHLDYDYCYRVPFHSIVSTSVKDKIFSFTVDYEDLTNSESEHEE